MNIFRVVITMAPWIAVNIILGILRKRIKKKQANIKFEKNNFYVSTIGMSGFLFFLGTIGLIGGAGLEAGIILEGGKGIAAFIIFFTLWELVCLGLIAYSTIWRIEVKGEELIYRSIFGIKHKYLLSDITEVVYTKSGAFRLYEGKRRILTCDEELVGAAYLEEVLRERKVPVRNIDNATSDRFVIHPKKVELIIMLGVSIVLCIVIVILLVQKDNEVIPMLFAAMLFCLYMFAYYLYDKVIVQDGLVYYRKLFHKEQCFQLQQITGYKRKDTFGDGKVAFCSNENELFSINANRENLELLTNMIDKKAGNNRAEKE
jgi:hypothetical protein